MSTARRVRIVHATVSVLIVAIVLWNVSLVTSPELEKYVEQSEEWCDQRGGELVNSRAFVHGGLHCRLGNGSSVHMSDVVSVGGEGAKSPKNQPVRGVLR